MTSGTGASGEQVAERARDELGTVSILVNNAGVAWPLGPSLNVHPDEWAAAIAVNVLAAAGLTFAWIRSQDPARIGAALHDRFTRSYESGALITPEHSARSLLAHLNSDSTGQIRDVSDPL